MLNIPVADSRCRTSGETSWLQPLCCGVILSICMHKFSLGAYFFVYILFSADAFSYRQTSKPIFLVQSSENGRFRRPPNTSVPKAGRFRRHRKESRSRFKMNGLIRLPSSAAVFLLASETFSCQVYRFRNSESLPENRRLPKK